MQMAPPRKQPENEKERIKLERRRNQAKRQYEKKKVDILAQNRLSHEKNKAKWNASKASKQKEIRQEIKIKKGGYQVVVPSIDVTIEAIGGHFSGDGCCLSDTRCISMFTMDRDTAMAYEGVLGGSSRKQGAGFYWRTNASVFHDACQKLLPYSWTKSEQLMETVKENRDNALIKEMKTLDSMHPEMYKWMDDLTFDKVIAGFFTADGHCTNRHANMRAYVVFGQKLPGILRCIASRYPGGSAINEYNPVANGNKIGQDGKPYVAYQLTFSGVNALHLLERIYPWIIAERVKKGVKKTIELHKRNG